MKRITIIALAVMLIAAAAFAAAPTAKSASSSFTVGNPSHTQALGGQSTHASVGLTVASQHSPVVKDPPQVPVVMPLP